MFTLLVATTVIPQAQAGEFRRAMFLLCTLALMGTEDQLLQAESKPEVWARLGFWGRLELRVSTCLNYTALSALVESPNPCLVFTETYLTQVQNVHARLRWTHMYVNGGGLCPHLNFFRRWLEYLHQTILDVFTSHVPDGRRQFRHIAKACKPLRMSAAPLPS